MPSRDLCSGLLDPIPEEPGNGSGDPPASARETAEASQAEGTFAEASKWVCHRLDRVQLSPVEWPVLTAQLQAVAGDVGQYRRVVEAVLAQRPDEPLPSSIKYFSRPFAEFRATYRLPGSSSRASPAAAAVMKLPDAKTSRYADLADRPEEVADHGNDG